MSAAAADAGAIRSGLDEVTGAVTLARRKVGEGELIDLSGLDRRVDQICKALHALGRDDGGALRPRLLSLIDELNLLTEDLKRQQVQVAAELKDSSSHQQAAAAYRKPES